MSGPGPSFEIHEISAPGALRLTLTGELDLASTPLLEDRLTRLRALKSPVTLDLSGIQFIDSTGLHMLVRTVGDARIKGWQLQIDRNVAPDVMRLFRLVHLDRFILGGGSATAGDGAT